MRSACGCARVSRCGRGEEGTLADLDDDGEEEDGRERKAADLGEGAVGGVTERRRVGDEQHEDERDEEGDQQLLDLA